MVYGLEFSDSPRPSTKMTSDSLGYGLVAMNYATVRPK
jgi:hypothetical protein